MGTMVLDNAQFPVSYSSRLTSVGGILALLDEEEDELKIAALQKLNLLADEFWAEIAGSIDRIEIFSEDEEFKQRELAALVASKVYYHLGEFNLSMSLALGAGPLFDVSKRSEYVETLVAKFIDEYIKLRVKQAEAKDQAVAIDPRLEKIVENMFDRCFSEGEFKQALGVALESRRLDKIADSIRRSGNIPQMLSYCFDVCMSLVSSRDFRQTVFRLLVDIYNELEVPDYVSTAQILVFLDDAKAISDILLNLIKGDEDSVLLAYQISFDLYGSASQQILTNVRNLLPSFPKSSATPAPTQTKNPDAMEIETQPLLSSIADRDQGQWNDAQKANIEKLKVILSGETTIGLSLEFLFKSNKTDLLILKNVKTAVEGRNSVCHSATVFANAIMHAGTTTDTFLRENLEWLSRATNWAKFSATAGLGVIHKGHLKEGKSLLGPYLPQQNVSSSPYSEGGALYALGIIHANHGESITKYLLNALHQATTDEVTQHGACLGLGVAAMATGNDEIYENLKNVLYGDSAVAGEAAGLAMGLVMLGTASAKALDEMLAYAHETQHEKIIRGLAMGIALVMYGREEEADTLIEQLTLDKDPILRYGGMYTIGLAYCGTANNGAIRRLLHIAVSDVSDDVRRAAVTALGFLLLRQPKQCPRLVSLLAESYNPHVRYGATLAVGISCAGTGLKEAIELLEPMASDSVDYVRQGALIALSMVLIQTSKAQEPKVESIRKLFEDKIADKHEDVMAKFGAILATGIIDAGGRNVTFSLHSRSGHKNMPAIVGLAVFTQFWYWFPLVHFISLAFTPTAIIGLNKDLKMPKFSFKSNVRPSLFAYPPEVKPPTTATPQKAPTAILSTTRKVKARAQKLASEKEAEKGKATPPPSEAMEIDNEKKAEDQAEGEAKPEEGKEKEKEKEKEPSFEIKHNPARVTTPQVKYLSFDVDKRYVPVKKLSLIHI
eukprot:TRINITY_DN4394_c0_g1_i1.p1 TRINITY_DN4394_c0_g1~~TRINITY_DN4394_c0_g1_i1.p1  ORF type:complete len:951 (-),score=235.34 TRINITY_DN4394_c0_g1_i1:34-2886(-)